MNDLNKHDTSIRANTGIIASIQPLPDGQIRLIFDDACQQSMLDANSWRQEDLFTQIDFDGSKFENGALSTDELADIAEKLISRLVALSTHGIAPKGYDVSS